MPTQRGIRSSECVSLYIYDFIFDILHGIVGQWPLRILCVCIAEGARDLHFRHASELPAFNFDSIIMIRFPVLSPWLSASVVRLENRKSKFGLLQVTCSAVLSNKSAFHISILFHISIPHFYSIVL